MLGTSGDILISRVVIIVVRRSKAVKYWCISRIAWHIRGDTAVTVVIVDREGQCILLVGRTKIHVVCKDCWSKVRYQVGVRSLPQ